MEQTQAEVDAELAAWAAEAAAERVQRQSDRALLASVGAYLPGLFVEVLLASAQAKGA